MHRSLALLGLAVLVCQAGGCTEKSPCDEGQVLRDYFCWNVDAAAVQDTATAGGGEAGEGEASEGEAGPAGGTPAFGRPCSTDADCAAPAGLCVPQLNYCSALGCELDAALCPPGWTCMDLTPFGQPAHMCFSGL